MANSVAHNRKQEAYFRAVSEVIADVRKVVDYWPTVTSVELTRDGSHLTVYLTFEKHGEKAIDLLREAKGFVRSELAKMNEQRITPDVHFAIDNAYENGRKIEQILKEIKKDK